MKIFYKISKHFRKILSVFMVILQMRVAGLISNVVHMDGVKGYKAIVRDFSEFLKEEDINDVQNIYEYYNYAMWNGYFSKDHKLQYSMDRNYFADNNGMSIMSGSAVCLNYADMLSLIFKEMGFNSYVSMCYIDPENLSVERIRTDASIERKIDASGSAIFDNAIIKSITKLTGNHAVTCVESNGETYIFDPTNLIYLNKTGFNDVEIINGEGKFDLRYYTSLLFDNINICKLIIEKNTEGYNKEVLEKQEIKIDIESLEEFYNKEKDNIEKVDNSNDRNFNMISLMIYTFIANYIISVIEEFLRDVNNKIINANEDKEIKYCFPKLKEYFSEKNIKTQFEALKNYELIKKSIGVQKGIHKDILMKSLNVLETLLHNRNFHHLMLSLCLDHLGYFSTTMEVKKYGFNHIKRKIKLVQFRDSEGNSYLYDYELEELLCRDINGVLCSLDGKYKYEIDKNKCDSRVETLDAEAVKEKMDTEDTLLSNDDLRLLRKNKTIRY